MSSTRLAAFFYLFSPKAYISLPHKEPILKPLLPCQYIFVPLPPMEASSLQIYTGNYSIAPSNNNTILHFFPFMHLLTFKSHVYPHYIIYDLSQKLQGFFGDNLSSEFETFTAKLKSNTLTTAIKQCYQLYKRWTQCQVPISFLREKECDEPEWYILIPAPTIVVATVQAEVGLLYYYNHNFMGVTCYRIASLGWSFTIGCYALQVKIASLLAHIHYRAHAAQQ